MSKGLQAANLIGGWAVMITLGWHIRGWVEKKPEPVPPPVQRYVNFDHGSDSECDGKSPHAAGCGKPCAWKHVQRALLDDIPPQGKQINLSPGVYPAGEAWKTPPVMDGGHPGPLTIMGGMTPTVSPGSIPSSFQVETAVADALTPDAGLRPWDFDTVVGGIPADAGNVPPPWHWAKSPDGGTHIVHGDDPSKTWIHWSVLTGPPSAVMATRDHDGGWRVEPLP